MIPSLSTVRVTIDWVALGKHSGAASTIHVASTSEGRFTPSRWRISPSFSSDRAVRGFMMRSHPLSLVFASGSGSAQALSPVIERGDSVLCMSAKLMPGQAIAQVTSSEIPVGVSGLEEKISTPNFSRISRGVTNLLRDPALRGGSAANVAEFIRDSFLFPQAVGYGLAIVLRKASALGTFCGSQSACLEFSPVCEKSTGVL